MGGSAAGGGALIGLACFVVSNVNPIPGNDAVPIAALLATAWTVTGLRVPGSGWRVPRAWGRFGPSAYSALFGLVLGSGVMVALPSAGYVVLIVAGVSENSWLLTIAAFSLFGLLRVIPVIIVARQVHRHADGESALDRLGVLAGRAATAEIATSIGLALLVLDSV